MYMMETNTTKGPTRKFRVLKRALLATLNKMLRLEKNSRKTSTSTLEVTLIDNYLVLNIPGVNMRIEANTSGSARFTIPLAYFIHVVKDQEDNTLEFHLSKDWLGIRTNSFPVQSTFFENDRILRSIQLPMNYTRADLAKLILSGQYTDEEIEFNDLAEAAGDVLRAAREDFKKVAHILRPYGLDKQYVHNMILQGLKH
jgi:hypothetical protein